MIEIRYVNNTDLKVIAEIHVNSWKAAYSEILPENILSELNVNDYLKNWNNWINNGANVLVISEDNSIKGFISFSFQKSAECVEITAFYIDPHSYRKNYGTALLNFFQYEVKRMKP